MNIYEMLDRIKAGLSLLEKPKQMPQLNVVVDRINFRIQYLSDQMNQLGQEWFVGHATITPSTTGTTLPGGFVRAIESSTNNFEVDFIRSTRRNLSSENTSVTNFLYPELAGGYAYIQGNQIFFASGVTEPQVLYFVRSHPKIHAARVSAATASSITFPSARNLGVIIDEDDYYNNATVRIIKNTGSGQSRIISDYDGETREATISEDWTITPDTTSVYEIKCELPDSPDMQTILCDMVVADIAKDKNALAEARVNMLEALESLSERQTRTPDGR